jgi:NAD(P)-dependent dehydrogenase (short-subunit alcohol dehydrogenase family)
MVTGAASGVGAATVTTLLQRGYTVHALMRGPAAAPASSSPGATVIRCDISDPAAVESAFAELNSLTRGELYGLVHCAAIASASAVETTTVEDLRRVLDTNVTGALSLIRGAMPMLRRSGGRLVAISSLSSRVSMPLQGAYCASKAALEALLDTLRREIVGSGVTISIIQPGGIKTRMAIEHGRRVAAGISSLTGEHATHYRALFEAHQRLVSMGRESSIEPTEVVKSVVHALEAKRPRIRYRIGNDARRLLRMSATLSDRRMDEFIDSLHRMPPT